MTTTVQAARRAFLAAVEPPCNHGASYGHADGTRHCLLCPSTSDDVLPLTPRPPDPTPVILAAVHNDPLPSRQTDREHIEAAVVRCAAEHGGEVHISWLRRYVARDVMPEMWGAVVHARRGFLEPAGYHLPSMGGSGNARKLSPVWRYVGPAGNPTPAPHTPAYTG